MYVLPVAEGTSTAGGERADLAALVARLSRLLIAAEQPILAAHSISMWGYIVLTVLRAEPMRTQAALARTIGADKTRIIDVLDELQARGLIEREPDPADRRVRLLRLTPAGRRLHTLVRSAIRQEEHRLLSRLSVSDRRGFLNALQVLDPGCP